jgi:DNA-binding response OmpR family regulator
MARILLVDDDEDLSVMIEAWLSSRGHKVLAVFSGADGLEQMRFGKFDLIILDGHLPDMEGIDICREYRGEGGKVPILMLSGNTNRDDLERGLAAGVNEYMCKPVKFAAMAIKLDTLLQTSPNPAD